MKSGFVEAWRSRKSEWALEETCAATMTLLPQISVRRKPGARSHPLLFVGEEDRAPIDACRSLLASLASALEPETQKEAFETIERLNKGPIPLANQVAGLFKHGWPVVDGPVERLLHCLPQRVLLPSLKPILITLAPSGATEIEWNSRTCDITVFDDDRSCSITVSIRIKDATHSTPGVKIAWSAQLEIVVDLSPSLERVRNVTVRVAEITLSPKMFFNRRRIVEEALRPFFDPVIPFRRQWIRAVDEQPVAKDIPRLISGIKMTDRWGNCYFLGSKEVQHGIGSAIQTLVTQLAHALGDAHTISSLSGLPDYLESGEHSRGLGGFLESLPDHAPTVGVLKLIHQEMLFPAVMQLREGFYDAMPYKDQRGQWRVDIVIEGPPLPQRSDGTLHPRSESRIHDGVIRVIHKHAETSHSASEGGARDFNFWWTLSLTLSSHAKALVGAEVAVRHVQIGKHVPSTRRDEVLELLRPFMPLTARVGRVWRKPRQHVWAAVVVTLNRLGHRMRLLDVDGRPVFEVPQLGSVARFALLGIAVLTQPSIAPALAHHLHVDLPTVLSLHTMSRPQSVMLHQLKRQSSLILHPSAEALIKDWIALRDGKQLKPPPQSGDDKSGTKDDDVTEEHHIEEVQDPRMDDPRVLSEEQEIMNAVEAVGLDEDSALLRTVAMLHREVTAPALLDLRRVMYERFPSGTIKESWGVDLLSVSGGVSITHTQKEQSHEADAFSFQWALNVILKWGEGENTGVRMSSADLKVIDYDIGASLPPHRRVEFKAIIRPFHGPCLPFQRIWKLPLTGLPVAIELPKMLRTLTISGPHGVMYCSPLVLPLPSHPLLHGETAGTKMVQAQITQIRQVLGLLACELGDSSAELAVNGISEFVTNNADITSIIRVWLVEGGLHHRRPLARILKAMASREICRPYTSQLHHLLKEAAPFRDDDANPWSVRIVLEDEFVIVTHTKGERAAFDDPSCEFCFLWRVKLKFDRALQSMVNASTQVLELVWGAATSSSIVSVVEDALGPLMIENEEF